MHQFKILLVVAFSNLAIGRECQKNIPNIDWITLGLDLSRADLHPPAGRTPEGQMARVIQYTCDKGKKWTLGGVEYDLPDQIDRIDGNSQGSFSSMVSSSHTLNKFKESMGIEVGMGINFPFFSFSVSSTYKETQERLSDKKKIVSTTNAAQTAWVARHLAPLVLPNYVTPSFKTDLDNLPATYAEDPSKYLNFINTYGTHFLTSGTFGGIFYFEFISDESLSSFEDSHTIGINAEISALNFLSAKGATENTNETASESFKNRTRMVSRYFGGEANLFEEEGFKAWWPTVITNPTMRGCELNPISALAKDKSKRPELDKAVSVHLLTNFLKYDAKYVLGVYQKGDLDFEKVTKLLDDINALLQPGSIPNQTALEAKATEIHRYAFTPDWMSDSVQICIRFIPAEAIGCTLSGKICVKPNTPFVGFLAHMQWCVDSISVEFMHNLIPPEWGSFNYESYFQDNGAALKYRYSGGSQYLWYKNMKICFYGGYTTSMDDRAIEQCTLYSGDYKTLTFSTDIYYKSIVLKTSF